MPVRKDQYIRNACQTFLRTLIDYKLIEDKNLFLILEEEACKRGFALEAHQQGVRGTHVYFRQLNDSDKA